MNEEQSRASIGPNEQGQVEEIIRRGKKAARRFIKYGKIIEMEEDGSMFVIYPGYRKGHERYRVLEGICKNCNSPYITAFKSECCSNKCAAIVRKSKRKDRFLNKFQKKESGCWEWIGRRNKKGYGNFDMEDIKETCAHRASWIFFRGEIPKGLHVLHHCDNPCCVNPNHLFLGTNQDNVDDKMKKGRYFNGRGTRNLLLNQSSS